MSWLTAAWHGAGGRAGCNRLTQQGSTRAVSHHLLPVIGACVTWLERAYGCPHESVVIAVMAQVQARQAVTAATWLRYPTNMDAALVHLTGPGGADRLDEQLGLPAAPPEPWRTWVDEVVVSWAVCLLADTRWARAAVRALETSKHVEGLCLSFRSLVAPDERETRAAALLRHPDLVEPVARLHRAQLGARLGTRAPRAQERTRPNE